MSVAANMARAHGDWMRLKRALISRRKVTHASQQDFADRIGISRETLSRWETGKQEPSVEQAFQWAAAAGVMLTVLGGDV